MLPLSQLLAGTTVLRVGGECDLASIPADARQLASAVLYFKCRSPQRRMSATEAVREGTKYIVLQDGDDDEATLPPNVGYAIVDDVNRAYARACSRVFGDVHRRLTLIGVTGTKGKTTVCHLIESALRTAGVRTGLISSLVLRLPESERPATNTTPDPLLLHSFLAHLYRRGGTHAVLEVSSIGIAEERVFGLQFDALAFTNLGSDHLEYHGGRDAYIAVKRRLFTESTFHRSSSTLCVINTDDPVGRELAASSLGRVVTFGFRPADITPDHYSFDSTGMTMRMKGRELRCPLIGRHNAENVLPVAAIVNDLLESEDAWLGLQNVGPLPGRLEKLPSPLDVDVFVDYAHTPESVEAALAAVREIGEARRVVSVIGCSGNSDKQKRPLIARSAMAGSDVCILTSDNPGFEHPASILLDMIAGVGLATSDRLTAIIDRRLAITAAIRNAMPDGIVVLMGKGTEDFQLIQDRKVAHSDKKVALEVLRELSITAPRTCM